MPEKRKFTKNHIIILSVSVAYVILVGMMVIYHINVSKVLSERFNSSVRRSLMETARAIEEQDILNIIQDIASDSISQSDNARAILSNNSPHKTYSILFGAPNPSSVHSLDNPHHHHHDTSHSQVRQARALMFEVLARKYEYASSRTIRERIDPLFVRNTISRTLLNYGIEDDFQFCIVCRKGGVMEFFDEKPFDIDDQSPDSYIYEQNLFHRDVNDHCFSLIVKVNGRKSYIMRYTYMVLPIAIMMIILLVLLAYTLYHTFNSEKLTAIQKAFVKNMTHELKTPVASISLASEMLSDPSLTFTPETYASKCRIINNEAKRLTSIIERILQTSVLEQKHFTYKTEPVDLNEIVSSARDSFIYKVQQQSAGGKILIHLNATLPVIYADRMHVTNVIYNMMDNALKYREPSHPLILEIVTRNVGNRIFVDFTDNGIGISRDNLKHIFDKFFRVNTGDRHDVKGFGLGLSYVKHVITHNGGNITVQSKPGVGSRFTFDFPAFRS